MLQKPIKLENICRPLEKFQNLINIGPLKFIYSGKPKFCEIFTLLLTVCIVVKSKVKISQNLVVFSEYMNFNIETSMNKAVGPGKKSKINKRRAYVYSGL